MDAELAPKQKQTRVEAGHAPLAQRLKPALEMAGARVPLPSTWHPRLQRPRDHEWTGCPGSQQGQADTKAAMEPLLLLAATCTGGWIMYPPNPCVGGLTPSISEYGRLWRQGLLRGD